MQVSVPKDVIVTVRTLTGDTVLDAALPSSMSVCSLKQKLPHKAGVGVRLLNDITELTDTTILQELVAQNGTLEITAISWSLVISELERAHYLSHLNHCWRIFRMRPQEFLRYPEAARADKAFVLETLRVTQGCTTLLQYVNESLLSDKDFMTQAVQQSSSALKYASSAIKADREVVLQAIHQHKSAIDYADDTLKGDPDILAALGSD